MKLSEAILLGSTKLAPKAGRLIRTLAETSRPRRRNQQLLKSILNRLGLL
jgi:hypothetical protein